MLQHGIGCRVFCRKCCGGFDTGETGIKVVAALYGRRWVCRPRFAGDPSGDPAVVGQCLGLMHRCAADVALHSIACASMEPAAALR